MSNTGIKGIKEFNVEVKCSTVGELKEFLKNCPDEWELVTTNDDADCIPIIAVNTYWHGAVTFEYEKG